MGKRGQTVGKKVADSNRNWYAGERARMIALSPRTFKEDAKMPVQSLPLEVQQLDFESQASDNALVHSFEAAARMRKAAGDQIEIADQLRNATVATVKGQVEAALGLPELIRRVWGDLRAWVIEGRTVDAHALRAQFESKLAAFISQARRAQRSVELATKYDQQVPRAGEIPDAIAELSRFHETVLARWRTAEDLEDLVAAEYRLPMARLDAIGTKHPAPSAWYEQIDDPFTPREV